MMRVFVTGATGFIGRRLVERLLARGDDVLALTRSAGRARGAVHTSVRIVEGDPAVQGTWMAEAAGCDAIVHLAGEPVMGARWSDEHKARVLSSRVDGTRNIVQALSRGGARVRVLVSASAVGYYGPRDETPLDESSPPGGDFLAEVCQSWEAVAREAATPNRRTVQLRIGIVLGESGGALDKMLPPFRAFIGGLIGSGTQWMSFIHRDDLIGLFLLALDDARASGPLNGTAPHPVTMREFAKTLGRVLHRPAWVPVPAAAIKLAFGEGATAVLDGQRVLPKVAEKLGYSFRFPTLEAALADILR